MFIQKILFTKEECDSILGLATTWNSSMVLVNKTKSYISTRRNSLESIISTTVELNDIILTKLNKFNIDSLPNTNKLIKYTSGSFFVNHKDRSEFTPNRLLTLIIQLSDDIDYTGAELLVKGNVVSKKIGNLILFDSGIYHEVTPLISGERYVFVTWIEKENISPLTKTLL
jgi:predicted 2-oxoglutarate/Fe(II)-dependent dioxygenase YbiX